MWYGALFDKPWRAEQHWTEAEARRAKANSPRMFAISLVCEAIIATALVHVLGRIPHSPVITVMIVMGSAIGLVMPTMVMNHGYAQRSLKLVLIDAGHWLAVFFAMAAVFVALGV